MKFRLSQPGLSAFLVLITVWKVKNEKLGKNSNEYLLLIDHYLKTMEMVRSDFSCCHQINKTDKVLSEAYLTSTTL